MKCGFLLSLPTGARKICSKVILLQDKDTQKNLKFLKIDETCEFTSNYLEAADSKEER